MLRGAWREEEMPEGAVTYLRGGVEGLVVRVEVLVELEDRSNVPAAALDGQVSTLPPVNAGTPNAGNRTHR